MGEILECLEDLDLMSWRRGSTRHEGATREIDDGVLGGLDGAALNSQRYLIQTASPLTYQVAIGHLKWGQRENKLRQDKRERELGALGLGVDRLIQ